MAWRPDAWERNPLTTLEPDDVNPWRDGVIWPPVSPQRACANLGALKVQRQAALDAGDTATAAAASEYIADMLAWRYPCMVNGRGAAITLGEIIVQSLTSGRLWQQRN